MTAYTHLQIREVFHLEFLRWFIRKVKPEHYSLKGGVNLRLFFKSVRYSEDMDIDVKTVSVNALVDAVLEIVKQRAFRSGLQSFGIKEVILPDMAKAKQTVTTQRFKFHLLTAGGDDLFTKIEFSRRGLDQGVVVESVPAQILRPYYSAPVLVSHYRADAAMAQKIKALAHRAVVQARDIFDIYTLIPQTPQDNMECVAATVKQAYERVFQVEFRQFRDAVAAYLSEDDRQLYDSAKVWEDVRLTVAGFLQTILVKKHSDD